jgi:hypothetical protein
MVELTHSTYKYPHSPFGAPKFVICRVEREGGEVLRAGELPSVSCGLSSHCPTWGSSVAATRPVASAPATRPGAAPGPPRVLWPQLLLPTCS